MCVWGGCEKNLGFYVLSFDFITDMLSHIYIYIYKTIKSFTSFI